jgi:NAD+ kinase
MSFKNIGIFGRPDHMPTAEVVSALRKHLSNKGINLFPHTDLCHNLFSPDFPSVLEAVHKDLDLGVAVGGDGTMLNLARSFATTGVPVIGVNLGRLGFLTDISADSIEEEFDEILAGHYYTEKRLLLNAELHVEDNIRHTGVALNDVVISKGGTGRMIGYSWKVNDKLVSSVNGDGVIVSSPTGSTAYALSAGGPIFHPTIQAISLVPVCPHAMSHRPIILDSDSHIDIIIDNLAGAGGHMFLDGRLVAPLSEGNVIKVRKYAGEAHIIKASSHNHFEALRTKLGWAR